MKYMGIDTFRVLHALPSSGFHSVQQVADSLNLESIAVARLCVRLRNHGYTKDDGLGNWQITQKGIDRFNAEFDKLNGIFWTDDE